MKIYFTLSVLLLILVPSCKYQKEEKGIFPQKINKFIKKSEKAITNPKKTNLSQKYNETHNLIEIRTAYYTKKPQKNSSKVISGDYFIKRYKYKDSLSAFSEFTLSKDSAYNKFDKSEYAYTLGNSVIILSGPYIYVISMEICNLDLLKLTPFTDIKIPDNPLSNTYSSLKIFINDSDSFPFFKTYIQKEIPYKDIMLTTIQPYISDDLTSIKRLENFIKNQDIIEKNEKYILFKIKNEDNYFLWNKEKKLLFLNFDEDDLKIIKNI